jgi:hypothetical protein
MSRFLLFYKGKGPKPLEDVTRVGRIRGVKVVAQPTPRSVLLEISNELAVQRVRGLSQWTLQMSQPLQLETEPEDLLHSKVPGLRVVG